jgi:PHD/YefM family antitoxin component YafN of YafNO toxin-antitoxin module
MLDITKDKQLTKIHRPVILTVKAKAAAVVHDAASYQRLLDTAAKAEVHEAIRQGLEDVSSGRTMPANEVFEAIRKKHGIPR